MTDVKALADGLSEAQREVFRRAKVREPHPTFMSTYYAVEFYGGDLPALEIQQLCDNGLFTLPIATGRRCSPTYHGEIHLLGLAVRAELARRQKEAPDAE